jgi:hypothetical protein
MGDVSGKMVSRPTLAKTRDPVQNVTKVKGAWGVVQVVEFLPNKNESLSSNPNTTHIHPEKTGKTKNKTTVFVLNICRHLLGHYSPNNTV